eukprot:3035191-Pleurochrysis_carterae.AAC.1
MEYKYSGRSRPHSATDLTTTSHALETGVDVAGGRDASKALTLLAGVILPISAKSTSSSLNPTSKTRPRERGPESARRAGGREGFRLGVRETEGGSQS